MKKLILIITIISLLSCKIDNNSNVDESTCNLNMENNDYSYGIKYNKPEKYLIPGEQSDLDHVYLEEIRNIIGTPTMNITGIGIICHWFNQNFTFINAGGSMVGKNNVDELYEIKTFYGCHTAALIISSILREFGFPAVMIETAAVGWAYDYNNNSNQGFVGHVMTEIYVSDKWILLDNNCTFVEDYDCMNPFISTTKKEYPYNQQGLFTYAKGFDTWDYSGRDESFTHDKMIDFAENIGCFEDTFNSVNYDWRN